MNKTILALSLGIVFVGILLFVNPSSVQNTRTQSTTGLTELKKETTKEGTGDRAVKAGDDIKVHYVGSLANGTVFENSRDTNHPIDFVVGQGQVIPGWDQGVIGMKKGEVRKLSIPSDKAYGASGRDKIPPYSDLYFEVELVDFLN